MFYNTNCSYSLFYYFCGQNVRWRRNRHDFLLFKRRVSSVFRAILYTYAEWRVSRLTLPFSFQISRVKWPFRHSSYVSGSFRVGTRGPGSPTNPCQCLRQQLCQERRLTIHFIGYVLCSQNSPDELYGFHCKKNWWRHPQTRTDCNPAFVIWNRSKPNKIGNVRII
jgi:hypothetical protein